MELDFILIVSLIHYLTQSAYPCVCAQRVSGRRKGEKNVEKENKFARYNLWKLSGFFVYKNLAVCVFGNVVEFYAVLLLYVLLIRFGGSSNRSSCSSSCSKVSYYERTWYANVKVLLFSNHNKVCYNFIKHCLSRTRNRKLQKKLCTQIAHLCIGSCCGCVVEGKRNLEKGKIVSFSCKAVELTDDNKQRRFVIITHFQREPVMWQEQQHSSSILVPQWNPLL